MPTIDISPGQQRSLCPSGLDREAKLPTARSPCSTCSATYRKLALQRQGLSKPFHFRDTGAEVLVEGCLRTRNEVRNVHAFSVRGNTTASVGCGWDGIRKHFKEKIITNT